MYNKWTPDDGQRNCPKRVEFHVHNKLEKLVHLVGFILKKFVTMHGHTKVKYFMCLVSMIINAATCTLKSKMAIAKKALNKKKALFTSQLGLKF